MISRNPTISCKHFELIGRLLVFAIIFRVLPHAAVCQTDLVLKLSQILDLSAWQLRKTSCI